MRRKSLVPRHVGREVAAPVILVNVVVSGENLSRLGIDADVPPVLSADFAHFDAPCQPHLILGDGLVNELGANRFERNSAFAESRLALRPGLSIDDLERLRNRQPQVFREI